MKECKTLFGSSKTCKKNSLQVHTKHGTSVLQLLWKFQVSYSNSQVATQLHSILATFVSFQGSIGTVMRTYTPSAMFRVFLLWLAYPVLWYRLWCWYVSIMSFFNFLLFLMRVFIFILHQKYKENKNVMLHGCVHAMSQLLKIFVIKYIVLCLYVLFLPITEEQKG